MRLMSDNDWKHIETAYRKGQELTLEREGPHESISVSVSPAEPPWEVEMLVGIVHYRDGRGMERKWCATPDQAREHTRHLERIGAKK